MVAGTSGLLADNQADLSRLLRDRERTDTLVTTEAQPEHIATQAVLDKIQLESAEALVCMHGGLHFFPARLLEFMRLQQQGASLVHEEKHIANDQTVGQPARLVPRGGPRDLPKSTAPQLGVLLLITEKGKAA